MVCRTWCSHHLCHGLILHQGTKVLLQAGVHCKLLLSAVSGINFTEQLPTAFTCTFKRKKISRFVACFPQCQLMMSPAWFALFVH